MSSRLMLVLQLFGVIFQVAFALRTPREETYNSEQIEEFGEDFCNLCQCVDRSFPGAIRNGRVIMSKHDKPAQPIGRSRSSEGLDSGSDMSSAGDSIRPAYALPPSDFQHPGKLPKVGEMDLERLHGKIERGLQKMITLANFVEQLDDYVSDRTKQFLTRLSYLASDDIVRRSD